jgi:hypothetical protein
MSHFAFLIAFPGAFFEALPRARKMYRPHTQRSVNVPLRGHQACGLVYESLADIEQWSLIARRDRDAGLGDAAGNFRARGRGFTVRAFVVRPRPPCATPINA